MANSSQRKIGEGDKLFSDAEKRYLSAINEVCRVVSASRMGFGVSLTALHQELEEDELSAETMFTIIIALVHDCV